MYDVYVKEASGVTGKRACRYCYRIVHLKWYGLQCDVEHCAICFKSIEYGSDGIFKEKVKCCRKCPVILCSQCWKLDRDVPCVDLAGHWLQYDGLGSFVKEQL
jgi:hypothetical protein